MKEEILRIMKMAEEEKISSEKAAELIEALKVPSIEQTSSQNNAEELMLKIRVISSDKDNVNVKLPVKFIKGVIASCGKIPVNVNGMENIDIDMLLKAMDSGLKGKIVDVQSADGDIVEIVIE